MNKNTYFQFPGTLTLISPTLLFAWLVICFCISTTLGEDAERKSVLQPAYIETTNGLFSVCAFNRRDDVLLRYKGLYISRTNLPPVSITRPVIIYALGKRPTRDTQIATSWILKPEDAYHYGKIPYPVKDIDHPLELYKTRKGDTLIGIRIRSQFYAVTNVGKVAKSQLPGITLYMSSKNRLRVVTTKQLKHREEDINTLIRSLRGISPH